MSSDALTVNARAAAGASAPGTQTPAAASAERVAQASSEAERKAHPEAIKEAAQRIDAYLKSVQRALEFRVDERSGLTVVSVRDSDTGELIRQIPNEEVLRLAQMAEDQTVVLLNETA